MSQNRLSFVLLGLGAVLSLQGLVLVPEAAAQGGLVLLEGDGRLGSEADENRRPSSPLAPFPATKTALN